MVRRDQVAVGERGVRPRVAGADRAHGRALRLRAPHQRDQLVERAGTLDRARLTALVAGVVAPLGAQASSSTSAAAPRSASAAIVFDGLTPSDGRDDRAVEHVEPGMAVHAAEVVDHAVRRVVGHRAAAERVHGRERAQRAALERVERRRVGGGRELVRGPLELAEQRRAARLAPADLELAEQRREPHPPVGGVAPDQQVDERVLLALARAQADVARAQRAVAPAEVHERVEQPQQPAPPAADDVDAARDVEQRVEAGRQAAVGGHQPAVGDVVEPARHHRPVAVARAAHVLGAPGSKAIASASPLPEKRVPSAFDSPGSRRWFSSSSRVEPSVPAASTSRVPSTLPSLAVAEVAVRDAPAPVDRLDLRPPGAAAAPPPRGSPRGRGR